MYKQYLKISLLGILILLGVWLSYNLSQPLVTQTFSQVVSESKTKVLSVIPSMSKNPSTSNISFKFINNGIVPSIIYVLCIMLLGNAIYQLFLITRHSSNRVHRILSIIGIICLTIFISLTTYQAGKLLALTIAGGATMLIYFLLIFFLGVAFIAGIASLAKED